MHLIMKTKKAVLQFDMQHSLKQLFKFITFYLPFYLP